jgi:biotin transport system substrate-specific component
MMKTAHQISLVALFAALITGGAWISLPIPPVPVVLSNLVAALSGVVLGPILGGLSVLLYLFLGSLGLPVFAGGSGGFGVFAGPTGGFLIGFFFSSVVAGLLSDRKNYHPLQNIVAILAGFVVLYAFGLPWFDARVESIEGLWPAFLFMVPYMVGDVVKAVLGGLIITALKPYLLNLRQVNETLASTIHP